MRSVDILQRETFVDEVYRFVECLSKSRGNTTFAIEGGWGVGKTYILDMLKEKLNPIQSEESYDDRYLIFHYNCWEYDYYEEPLAAILVPVVDMIRREEAIFGKNVDTALRCVADKVKEELKNVLGEFLKEKTGVDIKKIVDAISGDVKENQSALWEFDQHVKFREALETVKQSLEKLSKEKTLVFIVDELDRCLPTYAIKVLERLHHLFEGVENVAVILAIDSKQLTHSVQHIFGTDEDSVENYLRKFIDFSFVLDTGNVSVSFEQKYIDYFSKFKSMSESDAEQFQEVYKKIYSGLDIRTQEKLIGKSAALHSAICGEKNPDPSLLLFEILWSGLVHMAGSTDLKWLIGLGDMINVQTDREIDDEKMNFFKDIEQKLGEKKEDVKNFSGTLLEKTFWLLASLYYEVKENVCNIYKYDEMDSLTDEMGWAIQYDQIAKSIRWSRKK